MTIDNLFFIQVRTLHVVLVLCLNLAVDPPDVLAKVSPCAKIEAWFDPREKNLGRALEMIGKNLQVNLVLNSWVLIIYDEILNFFHENCN